MTEPLPTEPLWRPAARQGLHVTGYSRIRYDGPTRDYVARHTEGMTGREIKRCLPATSPIAYAEEAPSLLDEL